jgi:hypothetical protein
MEAFILTLIRGDYPISTSELLKQLVILNRVKAIDEVPPTIVELSAICNKLHTAGRLAKVEGGWKWLPPQPEPEVFMGCVQ